LEGLIGVIGHSVEEEALEYFRRSLKHRKKELEENLEMVDEEDSKIISVEGLMSILAMLGLSWGPTEVLLGRLVRESGSFMVGIEGLVRVLFRASESESSEEYEGRVEE